MTAQEMTESNSSTTTTIITGLCIAIIADLVLMIGLKGILLALFFLILLLTINIAH